MKNYETFSGEELKIADLILRRRLQLLVHSRIYYELNKNIITDMQWDKWAKELVQLQKQYPDISERVDWYQDFEDWDGSTGAFLPLKDPIVVQIANRLLYLGGRGNCKTLAKKVIEDKPILTDAGKFSLF